LAWFEEMKNKIKLFLVYLFKCLFVKNCTKNEKEDKQQQQKQQQQQLKKRNYILLRVQLFEPPSIYLYLL